MSQDMSFGPKGESKAKKSSGSKGNGYASGMTEDVCGAVIDMEFGASLSGLSSCLKIGAVPVGTVLCMCKSVLGGCS